MPAGSRPCPLQLPPWCWGAACPAPSHAGRCSAPLRSVSGRGPAAARFPFRRSVPASLPASLPARPGGARDGVGLAERGEPGGAEGAAAAAAGGAAGGGGRPGPRGEPPAPRPRAGGGWRSRGEPVGSGSRAGQGRGWLPRDFRGLCWVVGPGQGMGGGRPGRTEVFLEQWQ